MNKLFSSRFVELSTYKKRSGDEAVLKNKLKCPFGAGISLKEEKLGTQQNKNDRFYFEHGVFSLLRANINDTEVQAVLLKCENCNS